MISQQSAPCTEITAVLSKPIEGDMEDFASSVGPTWSISINPESCQGNGLRMPAN